MTKVVIEPGVCGFLSRVSAESEDQMEVVVKVKSGCESVRNMMKELGDTFDAYELCLQKPGVGPLYTYAQECKLALKQDASIRFED